MESEKLTRCPYVDGDETQCDFSKTEQCSQLSPTVNKVMRQFESAGP
jgi:hypothetical protein